MTAHVSSRSLGPWQIGKIALISISLGWLIVLTVHSVAHRPIEPQRDVLKSIEECEQRVASTLKPTSTGVQALNFTQFGCVNYVSSEFALLDYNIRRSEFLQQQYRGEVLLWMVVAITISGVVLAALQLYAAYRLAILGSPSNEPAASAFASEGQLSIEQGKISLRSSIAGVLILALSLAFFVVYVGWVYPVSELEPAKKPMVSTSVNSVLSGALGRLTNPQDLPSRVVNPSH